MNERESQEQVHLIPPGTSVPAALTVVAPLPCPFCGMEPPEDLIDTLYPGGRWREDDGLRHYLLPSDKRDGHGRTWAMHCTENMGGCGAQIGGDSEAEAIAAWNQRPLQPQGPASPQGEMLDAEAAKPPASSEPDGPASAPLPASLPALLLQAVEALEKSALPFAERIRLAAALRQRIGRE